LLPVLVIVTLLVIQAALLARDRIALTHRCGVAARHAMVRPDAAAVTAAGASAAEGGSGFSAELSGSRSVGSWDGHLPSTAGHRVAAGGPHARRPRVVERLVIRVESLGG
jgi:hypothetical protein